MFSGLGLVFRLYYRVFKIRNRGGGGLYILGKLGEF